MDEELRAELLARRVTELAYLEDRVRLHDRRPQLYGTQFVYDEDELKPHPIENPEHLDQRRAAVGLGPFAEYVVTAPAGGRVVRDEYNISNGHLMRDRTVVA